MFQRVARWFVNRLSNPVKTAAKPDGRMVRLTQASVAVFRQPLMDKKVLE